MIGRLICWVIGHRPRFAVPEGESGFYRCYCCYQLWTRTRGGRQFTWREPRQMADKRTKQPSGKEPSL